MPLALSTKMSGKIEMQQRREHNNRSSIAHLESMRETLNVIVIPDVTDNEIDPHHQY